MLLFDRVYTTFLSLTRKRAPNINWNNFTKVCVYFSEIIRIWYQTRCRMMMTCNARFEICLRGVIYLPVVLPNVLLMWKLFCLKCICLYDAGLCLRYKSGSLSKLTSCYNICLKFFFDYKRRDSVTQILLDLGLPNFTAVYIISAVFFAVAGVI